MVATVVATVDMEATVVVAMEDMEEDTAAMEVDMEDMAMVAMATRPHAYPSNLERLRNYSMIPVQVRRHRRPRSLHPPVDQIDYVCYLKKESDAPIFSLEIQSSKDK